MQMQMQVSQACSPLCTGCAVLLLWFCVEHSTSCAGGQQQLLKDVAHCKRVLCSAAQLLLELLLVRATNVDCDCCL
jgi:hypothetical protein